jgi:hypothetical protein
VHVHEIWTRARGGPIDDPRNFATLCDRHTTDVSQDVLTMRWALAHGLLVTRAAGPAWLAAGGTMPGRSREEALAQIGITAA